MRRFSIKCPMCGTWHDVYGENIIDSELGALVQPKEVVQPLNEESDDGRRIPEESRGGGKEEGSNDSENDPIAE